MTVITKSAKIHPAAKKCCGWEEPAIWTHCNSYTPPEQQRTLLTYLLIY